MFRALPINLRNKVKDISPNSSMIINTYFPQDPETVTYELDSDMEDALAVIENMMDSYQCNNVLIVGDLNTDTISNGETGVSKDLICFFHPIPLSHPGRNSMLITPMSLRTTG